MAVFDSRLWEITKECLYCKAKEFTIFLCRNSYSIPLVEAAILFLYTSSILFCVGSNLHYVFCSLLKALTRLSWTVVKKLNISGLTFPKLVGCCDSDGWDSVDEGKMTGNKKYYFSRILSVNILEFQCWPQNNWLKQHWLNQPLGTTVVEFDWLC